MRFAGVLSAAMVVGCMLLAACDAPVAADGAQTAKHADPAPPAGIFDYRYAFRLPPSRIEAVQESHARGCEQLGSARCRITAMRYTLGSDNSITAVLTMMLDPSVARSFGKAATQTVTAAHGTLADADVAGADAMRTGARADTVIARLREALGNAEAAQRTAATPDQKAQASARTDRIRSAIATIVDVDQGASAGSATAPVIFNYTSGGAIPGIGASPEATFDSAGETFVASLAGLLVVLAGIGPWAVLLLGGALVLRWILARTERAAAPVLPPAPRADTESKSNVVQRWFARDDAKEHETVE